MVNKKRVDELIPRAISVVEKKLVKDGKVDSKYNGYISSFGASIIQAGLISTITFFSKKGDDKSNIVEAIKELLEKDDLINFAEQDKKIAKIKITEAAVALKLAMRVFEKGEGKESDGQV